MARIAAIGSRPTHASTLNCLCRVHHLFKTFWGWGGEQLPDSTVMWRLPGGATYITTPGSTPLFPTLVAPTSPRGHRRCLAGPAHRSQRSVMMPKRKTIRAQNRTDAITAERTRNRVQRRARHAVIFDAPPPASNADPPPF